MNVIRSFALQFCIQPTSDFLPYPSADKARKESAKQRKPTQKLIKNEKPSGKPHPVSNSHHDDDFGYDEVDPFNVSSGSSISKHSSSEEIALLSGHSIKDPKTDESQNVARREGTEAEESTKTNTETGQVTKEEKKVANGNISSTEAGTEENHQSSNEPNVVLNGSNSNLLQPEGKSKPEDKGNSKLRPLSGLADKIKAKVNKKTVKNYEPLKETATDEKATDKQNEKEVRDGLAVVAKGAISQFFEGVSMQQFGQATTEIDEGKKVNGKEKEEESPPPGEAKSGD